VQPGLTLPPGQPQQQLQGLTSLRGNSKQRGNVPWEVLSTYRGGNSGTMSEELSP